MNRKLNIIQTAHSIPEFSCEQNEAPATAYLLTYLKKLKVQNFFQVH